MKYLLAIFLIFAVGAFARADDSCMVDGVAFKVGEAYAPIGRCLEYKCTGNDEFVINECIDMIASSNCKYIPQDNSKPYPNCCYRYEC